MNRIYKLLALLLGVLLFATAIQTSHAQSGGVEFSIVNNGGVYEVYMRADTTPADINTLTAQITLKVPHGVGGDSFAPQPSPAGPLYVGDAAGPSWTIGSRTDAPTQAPGFDYVSWDLNMNGFTTAYNWQAGQEILAFRFTNGAPCLGAVELMANSDPFNVLPNNPGNQISIKGFGGGLTNAYIGNYGSVANCTSFATIDKTFSIDGTTFTDDVSVVQYRTVTERLYYNNTGASAATGVTISATIPAGFVLVPGSTKVCLEPTPGEVVCNTSSGMGGPIIDAAVWNGQTLTIAPTAGLFGEPVAATSGRLEVGRKRYINIHECQYFQASINDDFTTIAVPGGPFATGTNASNTANSSPTCGSGGSGGHNLQSSHVRAFDTLGRRYFNFHECQYLEQPGTPDNIFVSAIQGLSGTNASNTPNGAASCGTAWGNHPFWSSNVRVLDTRNRRYFNISECQYYNSNTGEDFFTNLWNAPNTGYSTTAMTTAGCSNASGFTLQGFNHLALDTYDTTRGTGFIEFKMRANATPDAYQQTAKMEGTEFATQTDSGTITILPPPPVVVDKKFSTDGVTFVDDITVLQGTILTERLYYNNTDSVVGTGSTINTTVPAGFALVPNSTKVCLEPTPGEVICNTSSGMGGPIDESTVWSGQMLNIAPTAGVYGQPVNATSGRLEVGRKRYVNLHECQYFNGATGEDFFSNVERTGTSVSNSADASPNCVSGDWGGHGLWRQWVRPLDLLGKRYLNLHECQYFNRSDADDFFAIVPNAGTTTSNSAAVGPICNNINWGGHILWRQWVQNLDSLGNRYLNLHECQYYNQNDSDDFFTSGTSTGVNFSNSPDATPVCSPGPWGGHILWSQWVRPLDLLDTTRGTGFIEFQVVANAAAGTYSQDVTGSGNEFADYTDSGNINVRTLVDDDGDGIPNWVEGDGFVDTDGDAIPDSQDKDADNDGIPDAVERGANPNSPRDTDGDSIPDYRDLDSDNDGLNDVVEAGGLTDANGDGMADGSDGNGDGMIDAPQNNPVDSDGDGIDNYIDLDSDNDTVSDLLEGGSGATDANNDGVADGPDSDGDGIVDSADDLSGFGDAAGPALPNKDSGSDNDSAPDYLDADDDGNGGAHDIDAAGNGNLDTNNNGMLDANDTGGGVDADGDGIDDLVDEDNSVFGGLNNDTDGDGTPNTLDADDDNDGIPDTVEAANAPANGDTDGDGVPDGLDLDSDNDGINDVIEAGGADTDGDGQIDNPATNQGTLTNPTNSDGDGQPNYLDLDSDNDTLSDLVEGGSVGSDTDDDGMVDGPDSDGDGIQDSVDGLSGFGDADVGGLPDKDSGSDDDGAPDYADPDDDSTGLNDIELTTNAGLDTNGDGIVDGGDTAGGTDVDNDGIDDLVDEDTGNFGGLPLPVVIDSDGDGSPDQIDTDDDNDGILDTAETGDTDGDGIPDRVEPNNVDTDNDGNPNHNDNDDDGDGIPTATECPSYPECPDADGDGIPDYLEHNGPSPAGDQDGDGIVDADDPDADGDGIPDAVEGSGDVDGDGIPNNLDLDSDGDGIPDVIEAGGTDANGDGEADGTDANNDGIIDAPLDPFAEDLDGDGIPDAYEPNNGDTDGDGQPNHNDNDDDGDSIPTAIECPVFPNCPDADSDGIPNYLEHNGPAPAGDSDGDGIPDAFDGDSDGDGIPDAVEGAIDTDNDGTPDNRDLDSDNDGIQDVIEAGGVDTNGDGEQDGAADADGDGIVDSVDPDQGGAPLPLTDTDSDNVPDYLENNYADPDGDGNPNVNDPDDDGDGIPTATECPAGPPCPDSDQDGIPDYLEASGASPASDNDGDGVPDDQDLDSDNDGILDATEGNVDTDGDGTPDHLDSDSDNDGIPDVIEAGGADADGDGQLDGGTNPTTGIPTNGPLNPAAEDADGDNVPDYLESAVTDTDGDGMPNQFDDNDDGDYLPTAAECPNGPVCPDSDGDGIPNYLEANDNPATGGTVEGDTDGDGIADANDPDSDGDGIPDAVEGTGDVDGDGIPNNLDTDSDGDGVNDVIEAGGTDGNGDGEADGTDANNDGIVDTPLDPFSQDADSDGIPDAYEPDDANTDGDGTPNENDNDDDGDGIPTATECPSFPNCPDADNDGIPDYLEHNGPAPAGDTDGDGIPDALDGDSDGDGIPDAEEGAAGGLLDTDGDGVPDHRDLDSDNDGINDVIEGGGTDANGDGKQDGAADADGDGLVDSVDPDQGGAALPTPDSDGDGQDNYQDLDSDNDTVSDLVEGGSGATDANDDGVADGPDSDGDGIVDSADGLSGFGDTGSPALPDKDSGSDDNGAPDYADVDDDSNSGALDIDDAGNGALDNNNDGAIDNAADLDNDGVADVVDVDDANFGGLPATITSVAMPVKLFLQGAYDELGNTMRDDLRVLSSFPLISPYGSGEVTSAGVLAVSDINNGIVDWVLVELRNENSNTTVVASVAGLVQRDGDVVSASDGTSTLSFTGVTAGNYYVAVHHRNHLAAMTANPVAVSGSTPLVNFTTMNDAATFGANSQVELESGVYGLWAGNVNGNSTIIRSSTGNDLDPLINTVLDDLGNSAKNTNYVVDGYLPGDVNLDGQVIASGGNNDINLVLNNVLDHPGNSGNANYIINEQLPEN